MSGSPAQAWRVPSGCVGCTGNALARCCEGRLPRRSGAGKVGGVGARAQRLVAHRDPGDVGGSAAVPGQSQTSTAAVPEVGWTHAAAEGVDGRRPAAAGGEGRGCLRWRAAEEGRHSEEVAGGDPFRWAGSHAVKKVRRVRGRAGAMIRLVVGGLGDQTSCMSWASQSTG